MKQGSRKTLGDEDSLVMGGGGERQKYPMIFQMGNSIPFTGYLLRQKLTNNGFQLLNIVAKNFIQILSGVLYPPLINTIN